MKVYGPYTRKDRRKHVVIIHTDGTRQTQSYPRYLMERKLGRKLLASETVDHENDDFTDDSFGNLRLLSREANARKEMAREPRKAGTVTFECPECGESVTKLARTVKANKAKGKRGPYCSRKCAGKASHKLYREY